MIMTWVSKLACLHNKLSCFELVEFITEDTRRYKSKAHKHYNYLQN
jgi:hypothetical protein